MAKSIRIQPAPEFRCLVVEDSVVMQQLLSRTLERSGNILAECADNGVDAVMRLAAHPFDLLVTDLDVPLMDGLKLVRYIRDQSHCRAIPIIVVTTSADKRTQAMAAGADAFIAKPLHDSELLERALMLLGAESLIGNPVATESESQHWPTRLPSE